MATATATARATTLRLRDSTTLRLYTTTTTTTTTTATATATTPTTVTTLQVENIRAAREHFWTHESAIKQTDFFLFFTHEWNWNISSFFKISSFLLCF